MIRAGITAAAAALALAAAGSADSPPACTPGEVCDPPMGTYTVKSTAPAAATTSDNVRGTLAGLNQAYVLFTRANAPTVRVHVGSGFAFRLHPGAYAIRLASPRGTTITPLRLRVPSTGVVRVRLVVQPKP